MSALNRRSFLSKLAQLSALSVLPSSLLWVPNVFAANPLSKVIFLYVPNGVLPEYWHPTGTETNFILPAMSEPFNAIKDSCIFVEGINLPGAGHGNSHLAFSNNKSLTMDLYLGNTLGQSSAFSSLQLGVMAMQQADSTITYSNFKKMPFEDNPLNAFSRLFSNAATSSLGDLSTIRKKSILDANVNNLQIFRNALVGAEKERLDIHLESIRAAEKRLQDATSIVSNGCTLPTLNRRTFNGNDKDDSQFDTLMSMQIEVASLALQCNLTRVVSIMLGNNQGTYTVRDTGVNVDAHGGAVHGGNDLDYIAYRKYYSKKCVELIQKLAATPDVQGQSLLDNTLVVIMSDFGNGAAHNGENMPYMLAGKGGSNLITGRYVKVNNGKNGDFLDSVAAITGANLEGIDYPKYGDGPISEILKFS
ncbi:MAG: DUF1552 domain-containing protein [Pseudomonadota bacterium]